MLDIEGMQQLGGWLGGAAGGWLADLGVRRAASRPVEGWRGLILGLGGLVLLSWLYFFPQGLLAIGLGLGAGVAVRLLFIWRLLTRVLAGALLGTLAGAVLGAVAGMIVMLASGSSYLGPAALVGGIIGVPGGFAVGAATILTRRDRMRLWRGLCAGGLYGAAVATALSYGRLLGAPLGGEGIAGTVSWLLPFVLSGMGCGLPVAALMIAVRRRWPWFTRLETGPIPLVGTPAEG